MRFSYLAVLVLQHIGTVAVQHADLASSECGRVLTAFNTFSSGFNTNQLGLLIGDVGMKNTHGVRTTTYASQHIVGLLTCIQRHLLNRLFADHRVKVTHHHWIRMRTRHCANNVERVVDVCDPVSHSLIKRIFKRA